MATIIPMEENKKNPAYPHIEGLLHTLNKPGDNPGYQKHLENSGSI
jgi:hypothetical protein